MIVIVLHLKRIIENIKSIKKNLKKYQRIKTPLKFKTLICPTGFGHSGSGTLLDYFTEFSNTTVLGYRDSGDSMYKKTHKVAYDNEIDFIKEKNGVMDLEKTLIIGSKEQSLSKILAFQNTIFKYLGTQKIYNVYFWEITSNFINSLLKKILTKNNYKFSRSEYRTLANEYILKFLNSLNPNDYLICDQIISTGNPETDTKLEYLGDFKQICVYRDPRDVYVTGIIKNEYWMPHTPKEFVEWFHWGLPNYIEAKPHPNRIMIRFEDFVLKYDETSKIINKFVGIDEANHIHKKEYFNPDVSIKNIGLYKTYENQDEIKYIEKFLKEYCYYG